VKGIAMTSAKDEDLYGTGLKWGIERRRSP
jgi:hypothetical protein